MAVSLIGNFTEMYMAQWVWLNTLSLAKHFGWEPVGTSPHPRMGSDYEGYEFSAYQEVSRADAKRLANAIEKALNEFTQRGWHSLDDVELSPNDLVAVPATFGIRFVSTFDVPERDFAMCPRGTLVDWCEQLRHLIALCRESDFMIG
ncbi:MAG: hypothetical protein KJZ69_09385 [Phycisphaerales bacterium]|nr:hypothetical protein [Phycisphaerales bacterium]